MAKGALFGWIVACLLVLSLGCEQSLSVAGRVQYQGKPIEEGVVQFVPTEGPAVSTEVADGDYQIAEGLAPGTYLVRLYAYEETGRMLRSPDDPTKEDPEVVAILPRKYNQRSSLKVKLVAGENNENFDLK